MRHHSHRLSRRSVLGLAAAALVSGGFAATASAQSASIADIARYDGPDRLEKLAAAAKKEGRLAVYTSFTVDDMKAVTDAFTAKYGIPVDVWRGSSEDVLQRGLTEIKAGRYTVDVFENSGRELEALAREGVLEPINSPTLPEILPDAVPRHHMWVGSRMNLVVGVYNTNLVQQSQLPKSWDGFLDPQWKGKLAIEYEDYDWFSAIAQEFPTEEQGVDFFRKLVATNGISVRKGHTLLTNLTASGEVPLAFTVFDFTAKQVRSEGAPLDLFTIGPIPARLNGVAVSKYAPHPNAAILLHEFMISDGQEVLAKRNVTTTNIKRIPLPADTKIKIIDPAFLLDQGKKWSDLYEQIVTAER
ncbi:ABC transporter substrate-binding protein [Rhizobium binxianense]